jgi:hypothetical protein
MESDAGSPRRSGRSTWRVLGTLFLVVAVGLTALGACVAAYVGSTPRRTLEVPRTELAVRVPKFYPLPSMGADASGQTHGVWVTLDDDGTATAILARDPWSGATVPWRPDLTFEGTTGVYRDTRGGSTYTRDGIGLFGPAPRGLDSYDVRVDARRVVVDLVRVRLGVCRGTEVTDCSRPGAPVYRSKPPPTLVTPGPAGR